MNLLKIYISVDFPVPTGPANHKPFWISSDPVVSGNTETGNTRSLCFARRLRMCLWNSDLLPEETISYRPLGQSYFPAYPLPDAGLFVLLPVLLASRLIFSSKIHLFAKLSQSVTCTPVPLRQPWEL